MSPVNGFGIFGYLLFWGMFALASGIFSYRAYQLWRYLCLGKKEEKYTQIAKRALIAIVHVVGQKCGFKNLSLKDRASIGHAFIIWGFFLFAFYYLLFIVAGAGFGLFAILSNNSFFLYYSWIMDIASLLLIIGATWGIIRRYIVKPSRLQGERSFEALAAMIVLLLHSITYFFMIAAAISANYPPSGLGASTPLISGALSNIIAAANAPAVFTAFFWSFWFLALADFVLVAFGSHLHKLAAPFNILLRSRAPKGALPTIDLENTETFGVSKITDFTRKQLLDLYACVACGHCQDACPAYVSEKPLNPKELIQELNKHLLRVGPKLLHGDIEEAPQLVGEVISEDGLWSCTTCRSCMEVCPVANEHMLKIIDIRRNLVLEQAQMPETIMAALKSMESRGHPWRGTVSSRTDWTSGLDIKEISQDSEIDILFWVGCTAALDDRCQKIAIDTTKILTAAGVNFAILGDQESCCGDLARRAGNEYLFQMQAQRNIETLNKYNVTKIITTCPHCLNTLKNEYPQFGGNYEVIHHTQYIADLIRDGKIKLNTPIDNKVTYHDPCYLGRYAEIYNEPRQVLSSIPALNYVEIDESRQKRNSFCCGGGGGRCWMEEPGIKISHLRLDDAVNAKADILAIACPLCMIMFEDAVKAKGLEETLKVMDIAELTAGSI